MACAVLGRKVASSRWVRLNHYKLYLIFVKSFTYLRLTSDLLYG